MQSQFSVRVKLSSHILFLCALIAGDIESIAQKNTIIMSDEEDSSAGSETVVVKRTVKKTTTKTKRVIFSQEKVSSSGSTSSRAGSVEITTEPSTPSITLTSSNSSGCNTPIIIEPDDDEDEIESGGGEKESMDGSSGNPNADSGREVALVQKSALKISPDGPRFPVIGGGCGGSFIYGESRSESESHKEERQIVSKRGGKIILQRSISSRQQHRSAHAVVR